MQSYVHPGVFSVYSFCMKPNVRFVCMFGAVLF